MVSTPQKKNIVVTDDDPGIRDILKIIFETAGYHVQLITNCNDLLNDKFEIPDLFLLDKQLSGVDGIDICRYLKEQSTTSHLPVIMISANPHIGKLSEEAGADAYIEKPFEVKYLLETVKRYI